jgi:hypothetical protein
VRGAILGSRIGLHLDDPARAAAAASLANQERPNQAASRLDDGPREEAGKVIGGRQGYISARSGGTIQPNRAKKSGMSDERKSSTTWEAL